MNKFIGVGNLGFAPEVLTNGCKLVVCTKVWDGKQNKNIWIKVFVFGKCSELCLTHLEKGRKIAFQGRLDYTTKNGEAVVITDDVEFL